MAGTRGVAARSAVAKPGGHHSAYHPDHANHHGHHDDDEGPVHVSCITGLPIVDHGRAPSAAHETGTKRREHAKARFENRKNCKKMDDEDAFDKFEKDKSNPDILSQRGLFDLVASWSVDEMVDPSEVDWILAIADRNHDHKIAREEIHEVREALTSYLAARTNVRDSLKKYDKNEDGVLRKEELRALLTDLNDGITVSDEEIQWVFSNTGKFRKGEINTTELEMAINYWYNRADHAVPVNGGKVAARNKGGAVGRSNNQRC